MRLHGADGRGRAASSADHEGGLTFTTHMVPAAGGAPVWTGTVFVLLDGDGRIRSDHQFARTSRDAGTRATAEEFPTLLVDGADAVVLGEIRQSVRATGVPYTAMCALRLTVEDGLITAYHVYEDSLPVANALTATG